MCKCQSQEMAANQVPIVDIIAKNITPLRFYLIISISTPVYMEFYFMISGLD